PRYAQKQQRQKQQPRLLCVLCGRLGVVSVLRFCRLPGSSRKDRSARRFSLRLSRSLCALRALRLCSYKAVSEHISQFLWSKKEGSRGRLPFAVPSSRALY